ncbi:MAG TPA: response regulator transcription factor [Bacteroidota bacterium]|nr:response regulator transcription factor [Bacteroidota bacterium]
MADTLSVVIADDHPIFRAGVRQSLEKAGGIAITGEAENGEEALRLILDLKPRVAILDIQMPRMSGLDVARRIDHLRIPTKVILLTMLDDRRVFLEAIDAGVKGYVLKDTAIPELRKAISVVAEDRHYISPSLAGILVERKSASSPSSEVEDLTPAELRVLKLIAELKTNQEIAEELFVSKRTVENHKVNISHKLGLDGANALLKFALTHRSKL